MSGFYMKCHTGNTKIDWSDLKEKIFLWCWDCYGFFKFNCGSYIIFINKTSFKNSWFNSFQVSFFKDLCVTHGLVFLITTGYVGWAAKTSPALAAFLESLTHCRNVAILGLFIVYYFIYSSYSFSMLFIHLNWMSWFLFLVFAEAILVFAISCIIFLSPL